jgi:hypothetical protein
MKVGRRTRRWTAAMVAQLRREVDSKCAEGQKKVPTFRELANQYGNSWITLSNRYYGTANWYATHPQKQSVKLADLVKLLQKAGIAVTN